MCTWSWLCFPCFSQPFICEHICFCLKQLINLLKDNSVELPITSLPSVWHSTGRCKHTYLCHIVWWVKSGNQGYFFSSAGYFSSLQSCCYYHFTLLVLLAWCITAIHRVMTHSYRGNLHLWGTLCSQQKVWFASCLHIIAKVLPNHLSRLTFEFKIWAPWENSQGI